MMAEQPTGTVTMLFTDIEGSTRLLERLGSERYGEALDLHRRLLREAFERHDGYEVDCEGDAFFVAFARAADAVVAASEGQTSLAHAEWPEGQKIRVRIGIHTGEPLAAPPKYVGMDVHKAARIMAAGHGGQVLLSEPTRRLLGVAAEMLPLGEHRLKDLLQPEPLYQLVVAGLPSAFPALKTLENRPTNLPVQPTALIGRENELADVAALLRRGDLRLVTLTGPGGTGKTRLALQAAADLVEDYPGGVYFVSLAPVSDPELLVPTVAQTLGLREQPGESLLDTVSGYLRDKSMLLLLDNLEQITEAGPDIAGLLATASTLNVLATSRAPLRLSGEHVFPVPPLKLPDLVDLADPDTLSQSEAVRLFIARAQAVDPNFLITNENASAIAEICVRVDGLPLAIELAAARVRVLSPQAMLARLDRRLTLLTGGSKDQEARQQTLRATIEWSYDLLSSDEQLLFARLGVFVGGCRIDAAEAVCDPDGNLGSDLLDGVTSLVEKSLLRKRDDPDREPRFWMIETIREYAAERLGESVDKHELMAKHAAYFLAFAEREEGLARGAEESESSRRLEADLDNLRFAHETAVSSGDADVALRLAGALHPFWYHSSRFAEGERRATQALALGGADTARPKALGAAGELAMMQGKLEVARGHFDENLTVCLELEDATSLAKAHTLLGHLVGFEGDSASAIRHYEQTLELIVAGAPQDAWLTHGVALVNLGWGSILAEHLVDAKRYLDEALIAARAEGSHLLECAVLVNLAHVALERNELADVRERISQTLPLLRQVTDKRLHVDALELLARAVAPTEPEGAARLLGAGARLREEAHLGLFEQLPHDDWLGDARSRLGDGAWEAAEAHGHGADDPLALACQYLDR